MVHKSVKYTKDSVIINAYGRTRVLNRKDLPGDYDARMDVIRNTMGSMYSEQRQNARDKLYERTGREVGGYSGGRVSKIQDIAGFRQGINARVQNEERLNAWNEGRKSSEEIINKVVTANSSIFPELQKRALEELNKANNISEGLETKPSIANATLGERTQSNNQNNVTSMEGAETKSHATKVSEEASKVMKGNMLALGGVIKEGALYGISSVEENINKSKNEVRIENGFLGFAGYGVIQTSLGLAKGFLGSVKMAFQPVETVKGLVEAGKHPMDVGLELGKQLQSNPFGFVGEQVGMVKGAGIIGKAVGLKSVKGKEYKVSYLEKAKLSKSLTREKGLQDLPNISKEFLPPEKKMFLKEQLGQDIVVRTVIRDTPPKVRKNISVRIGYGGKTTKVAGGVINEKIGGEGVIEFKHKESGGLFRAKKIEPTTFNYKPKRIENIERVEVYGYKDKLKKYELKPVKEYNSHLLSEIPEHQRTITNLVLKAKGKYVNLPKNSIISFEQNIREKPVSIFEKEFKQVKVNKHIRKTPATLKYDILNQKKRVSNIRITKMVGGGKLIEGFEHPINAHGIRELEYYELYPKKRIYIKKDKQINTGDVLMGTRNKRVINLDRLLSRRRKGKEIKPTLFTKDINNKIESSNPKNNNQLNGNSKTQTIIFEEADFSTPQTLGVKSNIKRMIVGYEEIRKSQEPLLFPLIHNSLLNKSTSLINQNKLRSRTNNLVGNKLHNSIITKNMQSNELISRQAVGTRTINRVKVAEKVEVGYRLKNGFSRTKFYIPPPQKKLEFSFKKTENIKKPKPVIVMKELGEYKPSLYGIDIYKKTGKVSHRKKNEYVTLGIRLPSQHQTKNIFGVKL